MISIGAVKVLKHTIMEDKTCAVIQCAAHFLYKKIYFPVPNTLSSNTWNFIFTQNMRNPGNILLSKLSNEIMRREHVRFRCGPINYNKLSKRRYGRGPLKTLYEIIALSNDDIDDLYS